jgi:hypothetical protein
VHEFGLCKPISKRVSSYEVTDRKRRNDDDEPPELLGDSDSSDDEEDGPTISLPVVEIQGDEDGPFELMQSSSKVNLERTSTALAARVHHLDTVGPFTATSSSSSHSSSVESSSQSSSTQIFKIPKQFQKLAKKQETPERSRLIQEEEQFLRSPEAISFFSNSNELEINKQISSDEETK